MNRDVEWLSGKKSQEIEVMSRTHHFSARGDSGSFVVNATGELVGLISAADTCVNNFNIGFMTPMGSIQESVKEMTGGGFLSLDQ